MKNSLSEKHLITSEATLQKPKENTLSLDIPNHPISKVLHTYLTSLKNIGQTSRIVLPHLSKWWLDEYKKYEKKLDHYIPETLNDDEKSNINLEDSRDIVELMSIIKNLDRLRENRALPVLARSLFTQIFCEFDTFTGQLLSTIYTRNSNLLKGISREISLTDLLEYEDLAAVKCAMLQKEIENFRRDSYVEQFIQLEKKFGITLRKFSEWGEFVELSQRRNLFTHNDGCVSEQYLTVCIREGWNFPEKPKLGDPLLVDEKYFNRAIQVMSKVAYMLCHTLWSKVFPQELPDLHESLNKHLYDCLEDERWEIASELGQFALSEAMRKNITEIKFRIRLINVVIGMKFCGLNEEAKKLLSSVDWSASYRDFKLAICVLEDNFEDAINIMKSIGKSGEIIEQAAYHSWPLFHKFRERPDFYETYESIYGEPYSRKMPTDSIPPNIALPPSKTGTTAKTVRRSAEQSNSKVSGKVKSSTRNVRIDKTNEEQLKNRKNISQPPKQAQLQPPASASPSLSSSPIKLARSRSSSRRNSSSDGSTSL